MRKHILGTWRWIQTDYKSNKIRFISETIAWALNLFCAITMMVTVPNPPLFLIYPLWITGTIIWSWAAYTRGSFGMMTNFILLTTIDTIALIRMIL